MNRLLPFLLLIAAAGIMLMVRSPAPLPPPIGASAEQDLSAQQLEKLIFGFLVRLRGHTGSQPISEVEARRIESMLAALNLDVPRGTVLAGSSSAEAARAAMTRLTPEKLALLPGVLPAVGDGESRAIGTTGPKAGEDGEPRSADLRLNGELLDPARAKVAMFRAGDRLEALGTVYYPVRIGTALVEFREATRLQVREAEIALEEGQILVRTGEAQGEPDGGGGAGSRAVRPGSGASASPAPGVQPPRPGPSVADASPGFRVKTPHAEMTDIGTAFVATAEKRRSRCEVLLGRVLMKSSRTGSSLELFPGDFAWTEDDGTLVKRSAALGFPPTGPASAAPGASGTPAPPSAESDTEDSTLIPSSDLPGSKASPSAVGLIVPTPTPTPSPTPSPSDVEASPSPSPSPSPSAPATTVTNPIVSGGGGVVTAATPTPTPTPPITPTPAPTDTP